MGSLPSATTTVRWVRISTLAGAFFGRAQNNPTSANTVSSTSMTLFIWGSPQRLDFDAAEVYAFDCPDCSCLALWKTTIFLRVLQKCRHTIPIRQSPPVQRSSQGQIMLE